MEAVTFIADAGVKSCAERVLALGSWVVHELPAA